jgi:peptidoglycan/LPS O-acetylase OafA/YrhL
VKPALAEHWLNPSITGRMPELDGIRGFALSMILVFHFVAVLVQPAPHTLLWFFIEPLRTLAAGMDLFFVLSGFLIGGILLDARGSKSYFVTFYARRIARIFPVYFAWYGLYIVLLAAGVLIWFPEAREVFAPIFPVWSYAVFAQNLFTARLQDFGPAWLLVTWSLAVEEQFYALAPLLIRFLSRTPLTWLCIGVIVAAPLLRWSYGDNWYAQGVLMWCRADDLAIGVLAAVAARNRAVWEWLVSKQGLLIAALAALLGADTYLGLKGYLGGGFTERTIVQTGLGLFFAIGLIIVVAAPSPLLRTAFSAPILRYIGKVSFAVYILHWSVLDVLHRLVLREYPVVNSIPSAAITLLALALSFGIADLSWRFFERPLLVWSRDRYRYEGGEAS